MRRWFADPFGNGIHAAVETSLHIFIPLRVQFLALLGFLDEPEQLKYRVQCKKSGMEILPEEIRFTNFLSDWLDMMKTSDETTTFSAYEMTVRNKIIPYFNSKFPKLLLQEVTQKHIQDYYTYEMKVGGVSANTVIHRHANIRKVLQ